MITKPIIDIAELYHPAWSRYNYTLHKTNWGGGVSTDPMVGQPLSTTGWTQNAIVFQFTDGYRQITSLNYKKYIDPFDSDQNSLVDNPSTINEKYFTQKLNYPISGNYSNYYVSGIYLDDSGWDLTNAIDNGTDGEFVEDDGRVYYTNPEVITFQNGVLKYKGSITLYRENGSGAPAYPYTNWTVYSYTSHSLPQ